MVSYRVVLNPNIELLPHHSQKAPLTFLPSPPGCESFRSHCMEACEGFHCEYHRLSKHFYHKADFVKAHLPLGGLVPLCPAAAPGASGSWTVPRGRCSSLCGPPRPAQRSEGRTDENALMSHDAVQINTGFKNDAYSIRPR